MSERTVIDGAYWIIGGDELLELWASVQLGADNHHRRTYYLHYSRHVSGAPGETDGSRFGVKLHFEGVERDRSNARFKFKATALTIVGLVPVRGYIAFSINGVRGDMHTVARKQCDRCMVARHTDRKRCDECGEVLRLLEAYRLEVR
jgi:hypothetical protein